MATDSSILAWRIPWTEESGGPQSLGSPSQARPSDQHFHLFCMSWVISQANVQSLSRVRLCRPMDCSTAGLPVHHQLPELAQTQVHRVGEAIVPSHPHRLVSGRTVPTVLGTRRRSPAAGPLPAFRPLTASLGAATAPLGVSFRSLMCFSESGQRTRV